MTKSRLETTLQEVISIQATDLSQEANDKERLRVFYCAIETAKEQLQIILETGEIEITDVEYWEALEEADNSLIAHVHRRL